MNRTRLVFITFIGVTLLIIILGVIRISGRKGPGPSKTGTDDKPPPNTVLLTIVSSSTKKDWLNQVIEQFNNEKHTTADGKSFVVSEVRHTTSGGSMNDILKGVSRPVAWSPGDSSWVDLINNTWQQREAKPIISQECSPTVYAPIGFAMWRPMAKALGWPDKPIGCDQR